MESDVLSEIRRMSRLLALVAVKGLKPNEAAPLLNRAGYNHVEAGKLLGVSRSAVEIAVRRSRKGGPRRKAGPPARRAASKTRGKK